MRIFRGRIKNFIRAFAVATLSLGLPALAQSLDGDWVNIDPNTGGITNVQVQGLVIRPFSGKRAWGSIPVTADAQGMLHGKLDRGFSTVSFDVSLNPNGMLRLHVHRHYNDADGARPDNDSDSLFSRSGSSAAVSPTAPAPPLTPAPLAPPPPPPPPAGPTLEQTLDFINHSFVDQGPISYTAGGIHYGPSPLLHFTPSPSDPCEVKMNQVDVHLERVDPRSIRIMSVAVYMNEGYPGLYFKEPTPETTVITLRQSAPAGAAFADRNPPVGTYQDKSLAERAAKAWIHAAVLCQKPESASPF